MDISEGARSMGLERSGDLVGLRLRLELDSGMGLGFVGLGLRLVFFGEVADGAVLGGEGERGTLTFNGEPGVANENEFFFCTTLTPPPPFASATGPNELIDSLLKTDSLLPAVVAVVVVVDGTIPDFFTTPSNLSLSVSLLTFARREGTLPDRTIVLVGDFLGDRCKAELGSGRGVEEEEEEEEEGVGRSWGGRRTEMRRLTGSCVWT